MVMALCAYKVKVWAPIKLGISYYVETCLMA